MTQSALHRKSEVPAAGAPCLICGSPSRQIGTARLDDENLALLATNPFAAVYRCAAEEFNYREQNIFCCTHCGFVFVSPLLSDEDTLAAIYLVCGIPLKISGEWRAPRSDPALRPDVYTRHVRAPQLNRLIRRHLSVQSPLVVTDIGAHGGDVSLSLNLPDGSQFNLIQIENAWVKGPCRPNVREFDGLLKQVDPLTCKSDIVLALAVLEHVDDPLDFVRRAAELLTDRGVLILEVPYEYGVAVKAAINQNFEVFHNSFFSPWSLRYLCESAGLEVLELELLDTHTGSGTDLYPMLRVVARRGSVQASHDGNYILSVDKLLGNVAGSITPDPDLHFKVFAFSEASLGLAGLISDNPGYRGLTTSNPNLPFENIFTADFTGIDHLVSLHEWDRVALRQHLAPVGNVIIYRPEAGFSLV